MARLGASGLARIDEVSGDVMRQLSGTELRVYPLCLGGNVFGWTVDEDDAFDVLDAYAAAGGNFIDTADTYTSWVSDSSVGGESEEIIGRWMERRGNRDDIVVATKVGKAPGLEGLSPATIKKAVEGSLARLRTDRIDLYYAHSDDLDTPLDESLAAFDALVREGKVRYLAASNHYAARLAAALATSDAGGLARYVAIQPHYNLVHRREYEDELAELCLHEGIACCPYYGLANGFLTGKYRTATASGVSPREGRATAYVNDDGLATLAALDELAAVHDAPVAAVALAWLAAQPTVVAPVASARTPEQLRELVGMADVRLSGDELDLLRASAGPG
jgi:aryl-alcohol dehydrogenase-like predicted oxidoreductase